MTLKDRLLAGPAAATRLLPGRLRTWLALQMNRGLTFEQSRRLFEHAGLSHRAHLQAQLLAVTDGIVQAGLFAGLRLPSQSSWGDGDVVPKLLGCYEAELISVLTDTVQTYEAVIDVGCADGYYAVGFARENAGARVYAFDSSPLARRICRQTAEVNGVSDRVVVGGALDAAQLERLLSSSGRCLLFMDCEGCERELLNVAAVPSLRGADILAECHDFAQPQMADLLTRRLEPTHVITRIREHGRDPNAIRWLQPQGSFARWLAVNECRPYSMTWLHGRARTVPR